MVRMHKAKINEIVPAHEVAVLKGTLKGGAETEGAEAGTVVTGAAEGTVMGAGEGVGAAGGETTGGGLRRKKESEQD